MSVLKRSESLRDDGGRYIVADETTRLDGQAVSSDVLVSGGPIWTGQRTVEALGVSDGRVIAVGSTREVKSKLRQRYRELDLEGRRAIPGLIDSHVHLVRAGLTWNDVVRWDDVTSLALGLDRIRAAAETGRRGSWLRVLGGWHPGRFDEQRGPTSQELDAVAGAHPVYVQLLYEEGMLNSKGIELLLADGDVPGVERSPEGNPTGRVRGPVAFGRVQALFREPSLDEQVASTQALVQDMAATGITGALDPGGFGISPESYDAIFQLWRTQNLGVRARLYVMPGARGNELEDVRTWTRYVQPGFGDQILRYVGIGEVPLFSLHDMEGVRPFDISSEAKQQLAEICYVAATRGWPMHIHAILDTTISAVLDVWEKVDRKIDLRGRRFSLAHAEAIGRGNLERIKKLGAGIAVQNRLIYRAADSAALWGADKARESPPLRDIVSMGIPLGAGTDATVVSPFNPWLSIWWLVTGKSFDGAPPRDVSQRLSVEQALTAYTSGSAWFSFEEQQRGHLEPSADADIAVLNTDPFKVDPDGILDVTAELTLMGGHPTHVGSHYSGWL